MQKMTKRDLQGLLLDLVMHVTDELDKNNMIGLHRDALYTCFRTIDKNPDKLTHEDITAAFSRCHLVLRDIKRMQENRRREQEERERQAREQAAREKQAEELAAVLPEYVLNGDMVMEKIVVTADEDREQVSRQLEHAPLLGSLSAHDMYAMRHADNYTMTGGAAVLRLRAVDYDTYMDRFFEYVNVAIRDVLKTELENHPKKAAIAHFFGDRDAVAHGVKNNTIPDNWRELLGVASPKFSRFLVRTFGERHPVVRLFNDRPAPAQMEKKEVMDVEGRAVYVSNLACNVMKMSAENAFSSCQNYTNTGGLEYLACLPSSVHDETLSIAYLSDDDEDVLHPYMYARILLKPVRIHGKLFILGYNTYGQDEHADILINTLRATYGGRFIHEQENYSSGKTYDIKHYYDYNFVVTVEEGYELCYECEGMGETVAETVNSGYRFVTECPICEGTGESDDYQTYEEYPYVNGWSVTYGWDTCTVRINSELIHARMVQEEGRMVHVTA